MKKADFKHLKVTISFEGDVAEADITHELGNLMMYNGDILLDIGFEDLAKTIYYSEGEIDINETYIPYILQLVNKSTWRACVKRAIIDTLK